MAEYPTIQEQTLYPEIVACLKKFGFIAIGETRFAEGKRPDILFHYKNLKFVVEVKIGKPEITASATSQAFSYAKKLKTNNVIILIYNENIRNQPSLFAQSISDIALNTIVSCLILTDVWTESKEITFDQLAKNLKNKLVQNEVSIDFNTVVKLINVYVNNLNVLLKTINNEKIIHEVVDKLDFFSSIGDFKDKDTAHKQVVNLASFLFFNQILFYHIFTKKNPKSSLKELKEIETVSQIQKYFDAIQKIDYKSIFKVNILGHIPDIPEVINTLNDVIIAVKGLRAEHITHDLAGRFFHDLIPFEIRKVLASFYTHPIAADILAGLTINSYKETIIDPACGSGTLLVSAYKQKQSLYKQVYGYTNENEMHLQFIEKDITGIDLMPFAAHISTINLTTQNIEQPTNKVRVATQDSLDLAITLSKDNFKKRGFKISSYTEVIQRALFESSEQNYSKGAISPNEDSEGFLLKPFDITIMNPPFSDKEKIPKFMQDKLNSNYTLNRICGNLVNLWGYFLVLGDLLIKENGMIGTVIPINFARGKATEKIRKFILKNHHILYIIKPIGDLAFSEGASFRDILLVTRKTSPKSDDKTKIVYFKKSIRSINGDEVLSIVNQIKSNRECSNDTFDIIEVTYDELKKESDNLMHLLWANSLNSYSIIRDFIKDLNLKKVIDFPEDFVKDCFNSSGFKGLIDATFITNPMNDKNRIERAFMVYDGMDKSDNIKIHIRKSDLSFVIPKKLVKKGLRTLTGIRTFSIGRHHDYFVDSNFVDFKKIIMFSKVKDKKYFNWEDVKKKEKDKFVNLVFARRFNLYSPNTYFLSFYSDKEFITADVFKIVPGIKKSLAKMLCLYYNSIVNIIQIFLNKEETTGEYGCIRETDLKEFKLLDYENLSKRDANFLLKTFDDLRNIEFPSLLNQFEDRFPSRIVMDKAILKVLGYDVNIIDDLLNKLYDIVVTEIKKEFL